VQCESLMPNVNFELVLWKCVTNDINWRETLQPYIQSGQIYHPHNPWCWKPKIRGCKLKFGWLYGVATDVCKVSIFHSRPCGLTFFFYLLLCREMTNSVNLDHGWGSTNDSIVKWVICSQDTLVINVVTIVVRDNLENILANNSIG